MCFNGTTGGYALNAQNMASSMGNYGIGTGTAAGSAAASAPSLLGSYIPTDFATNPTYRAVPNYYTSTNAQIPINTISPFTTGYKPPTSSKATTSKFGGISTMPSNQNISTGKGATGFLNNAWKTGTGLLDRVNGPDKTGIQKLLGQVAPFATALIKPPKDTTKTSEDLRSMLSGVSATQEGAAARTKMLEYINNPEKMGGQATTDYVAALNADHDAQDAQELAQFKSDWTARGYSTTGSDYNKAMNDLTQKQNIRRNTEVGAARAALYNTQLTAQLNLISQQYGIEMGLLEDMMNMDIYSASVKYGIKAQEITDFKNAINALIQGNAPGTENASPTK